MNANEHSRRSFLRSATLSVAARSIAVLPAISLVRAEESETVPKLARRLQAALEQAGEKWQVIVTAEGHTINLDGPIDPWQRLIAQCDERAAGCDGWKLYAGRAIVDKHGMLVYNGEGPVTSMLHGIKLDDFAGGKIERHTDLGTVA